MGKSDLIQILYENRMLNSRLEYSQFEESLQELVSMITVSDIPYLCKVFDDNTHDDEVMFGLIHAIEAMRGEEYLQYIAIGTSNMCPNAHDWAMTLNMRILNNTEYRAKYGLMIKKLDIKDRKKIIELLVEVQEDNPKRFNEKVNEIMSIINN